MPIFEFEARDNQGNLVTGNRTADTIDHVGNQLLNEGMIPIRIMPLRRQYNFIKNLSAYFENKKVTNAELALFTRQMYTLNKAGVPVSSATKHLAKTSRSVKLAEVLMGISARLESGQDLSSAMEQYQDIFTPLMIAMVRIGQNTGQLDNAFLHLTEYLELEESTIKRVKTSIRYPIFVIAAIIVGVFIINFFVIPAFAKVYMRAGISLPWMTTMLIGISNFFVNNWLWMLIISIIVIVASFRFLKTPRGKLLWHYYQLKIPIVGHLLRRIILLRFSEIFTIVVNSGIPISEGLTLVADAMQNQYAKEEILTMKNAIQHGNSIFQAAAACKLFTGLELQMLAISEETGELGDMLKEIALYYQREVEYDLKHLLDVVEPLLLLGIAVMVLFLALAVYMPIWHMVKLVHRG